MLPYRPRLTILLSSRHAQGQNVFDSAGTMSPEEKARLRELSSLIANERDPEKIKVLAAELEELLIAEGKWLPATKEKPRSS